MQTWLIVVLVVVVLVVLAGLALNPLIAKKNDAAIKACKDALGADAIVAIEPRAVGFGTEPEEAGGLRGQGCLAVSDAEIMFVTTAGNRSFRLPVASVTGVDTSGDPRGAAKAMVIVSYTDPTHGEATASWRVPEVPVWLTAFGYDWGDEGPPAVED